MAPVSQRAGITFVDYLAHLGPDAVTEGRFDSRYWGPLVDVLDETDEPVHWLHISADLASGKVVDRDGQMVRQFNSNAMKQTHGLLHEHLTWGVLARSCRDYLRVCSFGIRVRNRTHLFTDSQSRVPLWQAFRATYRDQLFGKTAMLNCVWINLFPEALANQSHQRLGLYLFENQPWEMAFINAWRAAGHGDLIGVAHSTTLFWDTRYFKDPRDMWSGDADNPMPWPERVAVNGPAMRTQCQNAGYVANRMVDVEALRYLDIQQEPRPPLPGGPIRILVCGEYSPDAAQRMLDVVNEALDIIDIQIATTYRPHPAYAGPQVRLDLSIQHDANTSIREAIGASDVVVTGAMSSVSVEAVCSGRTTFIIGDGRTFLTGPVELCSRADIVTSSDNFAAAISHSRALPQRTSDNAKDFCATDPGLTKWKKAVGW
jgi:surface carbohydrate biosynthesis protein (TIGR04326 family)